MANNTNLRHSQRPRPFRGNVFDRFLAAKCLGLPAIIMLFGVLVNITALVVPFWFSVRSETTRSDGSPSVNYDSMGLFLYLKQGIHNVYDQPGLKELNRVQKATNSHLVPGTLAVAQILWLLATTASGAACAGLFLVAMSEYLHLVAEIGLAGALSISGLCQLLSLVLSLLSLNAPCGKDNNWCSNMWRDTTVQLESINWGFFIAIIGTVMTISSAVMVWMQFCRTLRTVEYVRSAPYHPLDEEPEYLKYDYRKTARPKMEYAPAQPMVTLPQIRDDHGFPGVVLSSEPPPQYSPYDTTPTPKSPGTYSGQEVSF